MTQSRQKKTSLKFAHGNRNPSQPGHALRIHNRGGSANLDIMPPHSFTEWMLGQNLSRNRVSSQPRAVFSVELETDDESESDILKLAYPRTGRYRQDRSKKVHFSEEAHRTRAKKAVIQSPPDSDTEVSSNPDAGVDEVTTKPIVTCPCAHCTSARRKSKRANQTRVHGRKQDIDSSMDESEDNAAHIHARHKAKKAAEVEARKSKGGKSKQKGKPHPKTQPKKGKEKSESEVETTNAAESETEPEAESGAGTDAATTEDETTEGETTQNETEAESEKEASDNKGKKKTKGKQLNKKKKQLSPSQDQGKKGKQQDGGQKKKKGKQQKEELEEDSSDDDREAPTSRRWDMEKPSKKVRFEPSPPRSPLVGTGLIMRPQTRILQVEHAIETHNDPRPNTFYDDASGRMRVYHGQIYGSQSGSLYPFKAHESLPAGTSRPAQNPFCSGGFTPAPEHLSSPSRPTPAHMPGPFPDTTSGVRQENPWFQGHGSVTIGKPHDDPQIPDFTEGHNQRAFERALNESLSPPSKSARAAEREHKNNDHAGESNVLPTIEEIPSPEKGKDNDRRGEKSWDIQSAHGEQEGSGPKAEQVDGGGRRRNGRDKKKPSTPGSHMRDLMERDRAAAKLREERWSRSSKEPSPALSDNNKGTSTAPLGGGSFFGDDTKTTNGDGEKSSSNNAADWGGVNAGTTDWGGGNAGTTEWGEGDNNKDNNDSPKRAGGKKNDTSEGNGGNNNKASEWGEVNANTSEWNGGDADANNVFGGGGNGSNDGSNKGSKKDSDKDSKKGSDKGSDKGNEKGSKKGSDKGSDKGSKNGNNNGNNNGDKKRSRKSGGDSLSKMSPPGGWVDSPTKSEFACRGAPRTSPDNVVGNYGGSKKGSNNGSNNGSTGKPASATGNVSGNADDWGDSSKNKPSGNGGGTWKDTAVAQSSGGFFDGEEKGNNGGGGNGGDQQIAW